MTHPASRDSHSANSPPSATRAGGAGSTIIHTSTAPALVVPVQAVKR